MVVPKVSVVMAVYNGKQFVAEAIESILTQSLADFEFILIDDGSTDKTLQILLGFEDQRIRLMTNAQRWGLARSLNRGLENARGDYIARMDHDDISLPQRLAAQAAFLDAHPDVDVCGTWVEIIGSQDQQIWRYPTTDAAIRSELIFHSPLVHGSVIFRRSSLEKYGLRYNPEIAHAQDYEFWARAADRLHFANLDQVLMQYRVHPDQIGKLESEQQQAVARQVRLRLLEAMGLQPTDEEFQIHQAVSLWEFKPNFAFLAMVEDWLLKLKIANAKCEVYPDIAFLQALGRRWWAACKASQPLGSLAWKKYSHSDLYAYGQPGIIQQARFKIKSSLAGIGALS